MEYTKGECLGESCRFYQGKPDMTCFHKGILPRCSPTLKATRKRLNEAALDMYGALKQLKLYFDACYAKWEEGERVAPEWAEVVRVTGDDIDELCDKGFELLLAALAKAEGK